MRSMVPGLNVQVIAITNIHLQGLQAKDFGQCKSGLATARRTPQNQDSCPVVDRLKLLQPVLRETAHTGDKIKT